MIKKCGPFSDSTLVQAIKIFVFVLFCVFVPQKSLAQCTSPTGPDKAITYDAATFQVLICIGGGWISWTPATTGLSCTGQGGKIRYNSTSKYYEYCDASNWRGVTCEPIDNTGLLAHWKFDEGSPANSTANSVAGNGGNGIFQSMDATNWTGAGKFGDSLSFDGSAEFVQADPLTTEMSGSTGTMSGWIKTSNSTKIQKILFLSQSPWTYISYEGSSGANANFEASTPVACYDPDPVTTNLADGAWHLVTGTYDGSNVRLYIDGQLSNTCPLTGNLQAFTRDPQIGARKGALAFDHVDGELDDIRIYDRALSDNEVLSLYYGECVLRGTCSAAGGLAYDATYSAYKWCDGSYYREIVAQEAPPNELLGSLNANNIQETQISLGWSNGGGTTTGFRIAYNAGPDPPADCTSGTQIDAGLVSSYTVNGLTSSTGYSFRVCSYNSSNYYSTGRTTRAITKGAQENFFVLSSTPILNPQAGSLANIDSACLTELQNNDFKDKSYATLDGSTVKAFLCDSSTCNNLAGGRRYQFAKAGNNSVGGGIFITGKGGSGPGNSDYWTATSSFGLPDRAIATNRGTVDSQHWATTPAPSSACSDFTSTSGNLGRGYIQNPDDYRWNDLGSVSCSGNNYVICFVTGSTVAPEPSGFTATVDSDHQITLNWTHGGGNTWGYYLAYAFGPTAPADCHMEDGYSIDLGYTNTHTMTNLMRGTQYSFRLCSVSVELNPSPGVTTSATTTGGNVSPAFLVLTNTSYDGNLGGISGADSLCLTELTAGDWRGKSEATLSALSVKAFLCDSTTCNNLEPNETYHLAVVGDTVSGGHLFTTDASRVGPNDQTNWSVQDAFGVNASWWSGRGSGTADAWSNSPYGSGMDCSDWSTTTGNGRSGFTGNSDERRWSSSDGFCSNTVSYKLLCSVRGVEAPPGELSGLTATVDSDTQITLDWTSGGGTTAGFRIAYKTGNTAPNDCVSDTQIDAGLVASHAVTGLSPATEYSFRVCAYNNEPIYSTGQMVTDTTQNQALAPNPTSPGTVVDSDTQITVSWTSGGGTTAGFKVAYDYGAVTPADCTSGTVIDAGNVSSYAVTGLLPGETVNFRICAYNLTPEDSSGVTVSNSTTGSPYGFFVLSSTTTKGSIGAGATLADQDAWCETELNSFSFKNKNAADLTPGNVHAFLCNSSACNNLNANSTYLFAKAGDTSAGGNAFTTNGTGSGPGNSDTWDALGYFNTGGAYWSNRSSVSASYWGTTPSVTVNDVCVDWQNATGGKNGLNGDSTRSDEGRWEYGFNSCNTFNYVICYVNP